MFYGGRDELLGYILNAMMRSACTEGVLTDEHAHAVGLTVIKCITEKYGPSGCAVCYCAWLWGIQFCVRVTMIFFFFL